jgi:uncharacterized Rmd1/YagE family protein
MTSRNTHHFAAYAFAENFAIPELSRDFGGIPSLMDPRAAFCKTLPHGGTVFVYNFGAICFLNVAPDKHLQEIMAFRKCRVPPIGEASCPEDFDVEESPDDRPRVEFSKLVIDQLTPQRMEVVALTVAQSSAMAYYEALYFKTHNKVMILVEHLERQGTFGRPSRELHRLIAETVIMRSEVIGVLHLLDRPELIWDDKTMDTLYEDLRTVFDLQERYEALTRKLGHIQETIELLLNVTRHRQFFWMEIAIVFLILFEVIMSLIR